jgi:hypothetical protein
MAPRNARSEKEAREVVDAFMHAFNTRDAEAFAATLNYPHIRVASGTVTIVKSPEEHGRTYGSRKHLIEPNWDHSGLDSFKVIHSFEGKAHVAVQFTRYDESDEPINTYQAIYVVTCVDGHWGIQARSSSAP